jgi:arabinofuranosyltransferase
MTTTVSPVARASDAPRAAEPRWRRWVAWGVLAAPVVLLAQRAWNWRWLSDDGFIHLRVVRQLVSGNGPVFNAGERVEASTSPLWVFLLAVGDVLTPVRLEWMAVLGGIALTLAGVVLAVLGARLLAAPRSAGQLLLPAGLAVMVAWPPMWSYASSGLETGLSTAWLGACLYLLARWGRGEARLPAGTAVVVGLGPLIRPDLGLFSTLFVGVVLVAGAPRDAWRARLRVIGLVLAVPLAYQIFRMGYYGSLVPNPALAKEAGKPWWENGWRYLHRSVDPYWLWVPGLVLGVGAYVPLVRDLVAVRRRRHLLVAGAFALGGVLHAVYIVRVGGDFMHARLLLPGFFAFAAPVAVVPLRLRYAAAALVLPWAAVCAVSFRFYSDLHEPHRNKVTIEDFSWGRGQPLRAWFTGDGLYYSETRLPVRPADGRQTVVGAYGVGLPSYALGPDVYVLDLLALADPFTSHLVITERAIIPGHEKPIPDVWAAARYTEPGAHIDEADFPELVVNVGIVPLDRNPRGSFAERLTVARATLRCAPLRELRESYTGRLTVGRFFENLLEAPSNTRFRIPPEPAEAHAELCR